MATNNGEQVLDAVLALGYHIEVAEDGKISATSGARTIRGKAEHSVIEWAETSEVYQLCSSPTWRSSAIASGILRRRGSQVRR